MINDQKIYILHYFQNNNNNAVIRIPLQAKGLELELVKNFFCKQKLNGCKIELLKSSIKVLSQCLKKTL